MDSVSNALGASYSGFLAVLISTYQSTREELW